MIERMIVALDVGNTNMSLGIVRGGDVSAARRAPTRPEVTADELEQTLDEMLRADGTALGKVDQMLLASVVPPVTATIADVAKRREIHLLVADSTTVPMPIAVDRPAEVGADRLICAFAASLLYGAPVIVVSLGTATTLNAVDASGAFVGGAIAPGLGLGLHALAKHAAQLPKVDVELPSEAIGGDTVSAMHSGAVLGHVALVEGLIARMRTELKENAKVVLTGGLARLQWAKAISGVDAIDPLLTLRGLALLEREVAARPKQPRVRA